MAQMATSTSKAKPDSENFEEMAKVLLSTDGERLEPHPPANMMNLFMTRYDSDFNREAVGGQDPEGPAGDAGASMSGDVRNRPLFAHGQGEWDGNTIYRVDYINPGRRLREAGGPAKVNPNTAGQTAYVRDWFRPALTPQGDVIVEDDGQPVPLSIYRRDYRYLDEVPARKGKGKGKGGDDETPLYAGSRAAAYDPHFLRVVDPDDKGDGDGIAPKITDRESLVPRNAMWNVPAGSGAPRALHAEDEREAEQPLNSNVNRIRVVGMDPLDGMYTLESWEYGDVSKAKPGQLPQGFDGSRCADLLATAGDCEDKDALVKRLAGEYKSKGARRRGGDGSLRPEPDDTNPIFINVTAQSKCAVSRRLDEEGFVKRTMYSSDYINQYRLPELPPGNAKGKADTRNTNTNALCTAGEMAAGLLTRDTREMGALRNSHGTLHPRKAIEATLLNSAKGAAALSAASNMEMIETMRDTERHLAVDKADVHRHKLH